jgi:hypothetical protein
MIGGPSLETALQFLSEVADLGLISNRVPVLKILLFKEPIDK